MAARRNQFCGRGPEPARKPAAARTGRPTKIVATLSRYVILWRVKRRASRQDCASNVVIQRELVRMRTQPDRIRLVLTLVIDKGLDQLFAEDIALQQEAVILFQAIQR